MQEYNDRAKCTAVVPNIFGSFRTVAVKMLTLIVTTYYSTHFALTNYVDGYIG